MKGKYPNIKVTPECKEKVQKLSKKLAKTQIQVVDEMADFFLESGFDPAIYKVDTPAKEMKKLHDTLVRFIRNQEKVLLKPMVAKVDRLQMDFVDFAGRMLSNSESQSKEVEEKKSRVGEDRMKEIKIRQQADRIEVLKFKLKRVKEVAEFKKIKGDLTLVLKMDQFEFDALLS